MNSSRCADTRGALAKLAAVVFTVATLGAAPIGAQTAISADGVVESTAGGLRFPDGSVQAASALGGGFAPVPDSGMKACWNASGGSILCPGTGQDGELQRGVDWPTPRFTDNGDGTVTDNLTRLIWLRDAGCAVIAPVIWASALAAANGLSAGQCGLVDGSAAGDWRLPNIRELWSLVDHSYSDPALSLGHPFLDVVSTNYWSSTPIASSPVAWTVNMWFGQVEWVTTSEVLLVLPVRGGQ